MIRSAFAAVCCLGLVGCVHVNQGSRPLGSIISQSDLPQPGDWCRVTTPETGDKSHRRWSTIVGRVESVNEDGIELSDVVKEAREMSGTPVLSDLPYLGRRFKNSGVGRETAESCLVARGEISSIEIISEDEGRHTLTPIVESQPNIAQYLVAAVPGRR